MAQRLLEINHAWPMHPAGFPLPLPQGGSLAAFLIVVAIVISAFYWQHHRRSGR